jgi:hypothetical protein
MTTQSTPSSDDEDSEMRMRIQTSTLYGILVTRKSWMLALRSLSQEQYAHHLAHKIVESRLPPELCDEIGAHLSTLLYQDAERIWRKMKDDKAARGNHFFAFDASNPPTKSEQASIEKYRKMTLLEVAGGRVKIAAEEVSINLLDEEGTHREYMHLSASLKSPSVSMLVPGGAAYSDGPPVVISNDEMTVSIEPTSDTQRSSCEDVHILWDSAGGVARIMQLNDVGASIRGWNQKFIEGFVTQMDLRVVNMGGGPGGGLQPELRMFQDWRWF